MKTNNPIVGINLSEGDKYLCRYVDFLATKIPVDTVNNLFIFTARNLFMCIQQDTHDKVGKMLLKSFEKNMEKNFKGLYTHVKNVNYYAKPGLFVETFLRYLEKTKSELVFIGKDNDSQGAMAKLTIRHIPAQVLVVPEKTQHKLSKILVALDESKMSKTVLKRALELGSKITPRPEITCLYISHMSYFIELEKAVSEGYQTVENKDIVPDSKQIFDDEKRDFEKFVFDSSRNFGMKVKTKVIFEHRRKHYFSLIDYLNENETDLLVMGNRSHSGVFSHLLGSFTEKIITVNDKVPMLIVR